MAVITPVQRAMAMRPWLPQLLPQFDHIVWLDCDLWLQNGDVIRFLRGGAHTRARQHHGGARHLALQFYALQRHRASRDHAADLVRDAATTPSSSRKASTRCITAAGCGAFNARASFWDLWKAEVEYLYPTLAERYHDLVHLAEQIALNAVILRSQQFLRLDPLYNFHANSGGAMRLTGRPRGGKSDDPHPRHRRHPSRQLGLPARDNICSKSCSIKPALISRRPSSPCSTSRSPTRPLKPQKPELRGYR